MERGKFCREFKLKVIKLINGWGTLFAQVGSDHDIQQNVLCNWARNLDADPQRAFPGLGQTKPAQLEIDRLCRRSRGSRRSGNELPINL